MVDLLEFFAHNFNYFTELGLSLIIALVCYVLYKKTFNKGFLVILIGFSISIAWTSFELFVLQGTYFIPSLYDSDMLHVDVVIITMILGFINFILALIRTVALVVGFFMISNDMTGRSHNSM